MGLLLQSGQSQNKEKQAKPLLHPRKRRGGGDPIGWDQILC